MTFKDYKESRDDGDYRIVYITNGKGYLTNYNTTFGIANFGPKEKASKFFIKDVIGIIKDIEKFGAHKLWAELEKPEPPKPKFQNKRKNY